MATHQPQDAVAPEYTRCPITIQEIITQEKRSLLNETELPEPSLSSRRPQPRSRKMPSARGLIVALVCFLLAFSLTLALTDDPCSGCHDGSDRSSAQSVSVDSPNTDPSTLQSLLDAVSRESLHELLHQYFPGRYQHGVWPSDRAAVEAVAVHPEDGRAVTSLVRMLRRDNTTSSTTTSTSESPIPSTTTTTPLPTRTTISTTSEGPTSPSSSSTGATSPSSATSTTPTRSSSTSTSRRQQTTIFTSFVDGKPTIVTQTTYVDDIDGASQSTIEASLQTNAAVAPGRRGQGLVGAAVAGVVVVGGVMLV